MSEEVFRQSKRRINPDDLQQMPSPQTDESPEAFDAMNMERVREIQAAIQQQDSFEPPQFPSEAPFKISGPMPPGLQRALQNPQAAASSFQQMPPVPPSAPPSRMQPRQATADRGPEMPVPGQMSAELTSLLEKLSPFNTFEEVELPSKGKFYDSISGKLHVRPMTGNEEGFLATPRHVKQGRAVDMIFSQCVQERIPTEDLLTIDRDYLLIFLRGISYTPEYDADIKCIECGQKYNASFDLNELLVNSCPDDFGPDNLFGTLPNTGFLFKYRLATGKDEREVTRHRETRFAEYGDQAEDDTWLFRLSLLLEWIQSDEKSPKLTSKGDLLFILRRLPINDVAHLRHIMNQPPFGVDRELGVVCPSCGVSYKVDLPMDVDFFFPRKKKEKTPQ